MIQVGNLKIYDYTNFIDENRYSKNAFWYEVRMLSNVYDGPTLICEDRRKQQFTINKNPNCIPLIKGRCYLLKMWNHLDSTGFWIVDKKAFGLYRDKKKLNEEYGYF